MNRGPLFVVLTLLASAALILIAPAARACTENTMMDFIGQLEAPEGYDQVYYGVRVTPPRPLTTMSVREVLDWQREASRTAVSSAAGRYQVIRSTLREMVDLGVVAEGEIFDRHAQDKIASFLLTRAGYRAGETSPAVANRIAGIWAALPQIGGAGEGQSVYEGYAGNHALVSAATYRAVLACEMPLEAVVTEATVIRAGTRFGFRFDRVIEEMRALTDRITVALPPLALSLLLALFTIDIVLRFGRATLAGAPLSVLTEDLVFKMLSVGFFAFLILNLGEVITMVGDFAVREASQNSGSEGFSLSGYARAKTVLMYSFAEGVASLGRLMQIAIYAIGLAVMALSGLVMALVTLAYARLFLVASAGVLLVGMGGFSVLQGAARRYLFYIVGAGLQITTILLVAHLALVFAQDLRGSASGAEAALMTLLIDVVAVFLCLTVPASVGKLVRG